MEDKTYPTTRQEVRAYCKAYLRREVSESEFDAFRQEHPEWLACPGEGCYGCPSVKGVGLYGCGYTCGEIADATLCKSSSEEDD